MHSPSFGASRATSYFGTSPGTGPMHISTTQPPSTEGPLGPESSGGALSMARKLLTPRSPLRTFSATRSPFVSGRSRTHAIEFQSHSEPSSTTTPPLMSSNQHQTHYGFPLATSTPSGGRRTSAGSIHASIQAPPSQSASPSMSISSHNPPSSQTSPAAFSYPREAPQAPPTTTPYYPGSSFANIVQQGGGLQFQGAGSEGPYSSQAPSQAQASSAPSSRQTSNSDAIQVLTISTSQGDFSVPVDVHQASKLADEKRKRNAGASARFRQRRKLKEKDANTSIDKLNQQTRDLERRVREVEQERDYYRTQRDRLRDVVYQTPEIRHHAMQGPPSPRSMHAASYQSSHDSLQTQGHPSGSAGFSTRPASPEERAPRRRRTDARGEFMSVPYSGPPVSTLPPVQPPLSFPRPLGASNLPPLRIENALPPRAGPGSAGTPANEVAPPQYPPLSRSPYERSWSSGEGRP